LFLPLTFEIPEQVIHLIMISVAGWQQAQIEALGQSPG
jgi:hypothetical protein